MIGDANIGKTSILKSYEHRSISNLHISTIGIDFIRVKYTNENKT